MNDRAHAILCYWFGDSYATLGDVSSSDKAKIWFAGGADIDKVRSHTWLMAATQHFPGGCMVLYPYTLL